MAFEYSNFPIYNQKNFSIGDKKDIDFIVRDDDLNYFISACGDNHPLHQNLKFALSKGYKNKIVHGMYIASYVSSLITKEFIGAEGLLISFNSEFRSPIEVNIQLTCSIVIKDINLSSGVTLLEWRVSLLNELITSKGNASFWISLNK